MKLRLGQRVNTTDGPFGELADIIVDPVAGSVTHVVVQPSHNHLQARLVPVWLVEERGGEITVQVDTAHLRRLERVAESDFVKLGEPIVVGPDWDIGTEDVSAVPFNETDFEPGVYGDSVTISYDRIPKGECEIRRTSEVVTSDEKMVGNVDGFLADDDQLTAIVVRVGLPGFRHDILVPFASVRRVRSDLVQLSITEDEFHKLPRTDVLGEPDELTAHINELQRKAESIGTRLADQGRALAGQIKGRIRPDEHDA